jgi:hypothetical protein
MNVSEPRLSGLSVSPYFYKLLPSRHRCCFALRKARSMRGQLKVIKLVGTNLPNAGGDGQPKTAIFRPRKWSECILDNRFYQE